MIARTSHVWNVSCHRFNLSHKMIPHKTVTLKITWRNKQKQWAEDANLPLSLLIADHVVLFTFFVCQQTAYFTYIIKVIGKIANVYDHVQFRTSCSSLQKW